MADGDFAWAGSPSEPEPEPPQGRRRARTAPLLAAVAIAAVVTIALVMASGAETTGRGGGPVALAAAVTSGEAGFHFDLTISASIGGRTADIDGSGTVSERPPLSGTMALNIAGTKLNETIIAPYVYVQVPGSSQWLRATFQSSPAGTDENPAQTLDTLRAAGSVTRVGSDDLGGVAATHYHAVIDLSRVAAATPAASRSHAVAYADAMRRLTGSSDLPMDVWIDAQNRVRRITLDIAGCTREGTLSESIQLDYSDFGPQPPVTSPPTSEVSDLGRLPGAVAQLNSVAC